MLIPLEPPTNLPSNILQPFLLSELPNEFNVEEPLCINISEGAIRDFPEPESSNDSPIIRLERFRRSSLHKDCSGFAEKWHGHLAGDYWTSSAGCRCHAETPRKDLYRKRSSRTRIPDEISRRGFAHHLELLLPDLAQFAHALRPREAGVFADTKLLGLQLDQLFAR